MRKYLLILLLSLFSTQIWAEGASVEGLVLAKAPINRDDMESVKRGATFFATNCLSCHTLKYLTYDSIAQDAAKAVGAKTDHPGLLINGVVPPDLSLEADVRGADWIYTYLHSFYVDTSRPSGVNNLIFPNTAMTNVVGPYQGEQVLVKDPTSSLYGAYEWYDLVNLIKPGTMTTEQFDAATADVSNFLAYAAEPYHAQQERIGYWVLGFLCILFVMMFLLKKEYWKDVKKHKRE